MSIFMLEKALWDLGDDPHKAAAYRENPNGYLDNYILTDRERNQVINLEVDQMADDGVSTLLTLMVYIMIRGTESFPDYLRKMGQEIPA
ncbi:MAG: hypothetical protein KUG52_03420 [Immundisolibacteraceae bacterium]|nr:hypothetical protein [Immundisolibacteraceae bacterium]